MARAGVLAGALLALVGCATQPPVLSASARPVLLSSTPFFPQQRYQCGPAALAMTLQAAGVGVRPSQLVDKVYIPAREGSLQVEMIAAARRYGRIPYVIAPKINALTAELRSGHPVLVFLNLGWDFYPIWHYAVVIGYRPGRDAFLLHSGIERRKMVDAREFLDNWSKAEHWGVVLLRPGQLPAGDDAHRYLRAVAGMEAFGALDAAAKGYRAAIRRWPDVATAWLGLGNVEYQRDNVAAAQHAFNIALQLQPDLVAARNNLARILAGRGCRSLALKQIERALANAPPSLAAAVADTRDRIRAMPAGGAGCQPAAGMR